MDTDGRRWERKVRAVEDGIRASPPRLPRIFDFISASICVYLRLKNADSINHGRVLKDEMRLLEMPNLPFDRRLFIRSELMAEFRIFLPEENVSAFLNNLLDWDR